MDESGYTIKIKHYRMPQPGEWQGDVPKGPQMIKEFVRKNVKRYYRHNDNGFEPYDKGGLTVCSVFAGDVLVVCDEAVCSLSDNFSYKRGVQIAKGRALKRLAQV